MNYSFFKNNRTVSSTIWLLIFLFIAQSPSLGIIFCIKPGGLIEIETACHCHHDQSNGDRSHTDFYLLSESTSTNDHCGPCIDIPVSFSTDTYVVPVRSMSIKFKESMLGASTLQTILLVDTLVDISTENFILHQPPEFNSILTSLQTTILLC
jgi:hypothetical protein